MSQQVPSSKRTWSALLFAGPLLYLVSLMQSAWSSNPDLGHGWLVACFAAAWLWTRWQDAPALARAEAAPSRWNWFLPLGAALLLLPLRMFLVPYPDAPAPLGLMVFGVLCLWLAGLWLVGGSAWLRHFLFLAPLLFVSLPMPALVQGRLVEPLREGISWFVAELLNILGYPTSSYGTTLRVAGAWVGLDEACGGLRSLQLSWALALVVGELGRMRLSRRGAALLVLSAAALVGNTGRVLFLSLRAAKGAGPNDPLHDASGYATYAFVALTALLVYWVFRDRKTAVRPAAIQPGPVFPQAALRWFGTLCCSLVALELLTLLWWKSGEDQGWKPSWTVDLPAQSAGFEQIPLSK